MKKVIYKIIVLFFILVLSSLVYLSTVGIKTEKLNNRIIDKVKNIDKNLNIELQKVNILLDLFKLNIKIKTIGTNLIYGKKSLQLESLKSTISIKSLINKNFSFFYFFSLYFFYINIIITNSNNIAFFNKNIFNEIIYII